MTQQDYLKSRVNQILTQSELSRVRVSSHTAEVSIDVHGMSTKKARRLICNIINISQADFNLTVIHGYNHGTKIKRMLLNDFKNSHIAGMFFDENNPGVTFMTIRHLV